MKTVSSSRHGQFLQLLGNMWKASDMSRDVSLSKVNVKPSLGGNERKWTRKKQKREEGGRARGHSFPAFQFQGSSKAPVYISQWYLRAALEMCKSNSLTQRFIRPSVCSRVHALTRAHAEERRGRRVSLPIYDSDVVSFLRKASFFLHSAISRSRLSMSRQGYHHTRVSFVYDQSCYMAGGK